MEPDMQELPSPGKTKGGIAAQIAKRAPKQVTKYAYGALLLFTIAAIVVTKGGDNLGRLVLVVMLVFALAIALYGFDRMARSASTLWKMIGVVLSTMVMLGVIAVFFATVSYLIAGKPSFIGSFLVGQTSTPSVITNDVDKGELVAARTVLSEFEENTDRTPIRQVLPNLLRLHEKYPNNRDILLALGIAQFALGEFATAVKTFSHCVEQYTTDFKAHYHLGISYKRLADEQDKSNATAAVFSREKAKYHFNRSLEYFQASDEPEYYWWRLTRNIGWMSFQMSRACVDKQLCLDAVRLHLFALNGDGKNRGKPNYVLALNNLGVIYRKLDAMEGIEGFGRSYGYLVKGIDAHQRMMCRSIDIPDCRLDRDGPKAENRFVYVNLANYLVKDRRNVEAFRTLRAGLLSGPLKSIHLVDKDLQPLLRAVHDHVGPAPRAGMERRMIDGHTINGRTKELLDRAQDSCRRHGATFRITQGSYTRSVIESAGTHSGGGTIDVSVRSPTGQTWASESISRMVSCLRKAGFAAWYREAGELHEKSPPHIHAVAVGDPELALPAKLQVNSYLNGRSGLRSDRPDRDGEPILVGWFFEISNNDREFSGALEKSLEDKLRLGP
jgi:tetratricopeptide (TPR) repeat protein